MCNSHIFDHPSAGFFTCQCVANPEAVTISILANGSTYTSTRTTIPLTFTRPVELSCLAVNSVGISRSNPVLYQPQNINGTYRVTYAHTMSSLLTLEVIAIASQFISHKQKKMCYLLPQWRQFCLVCTSLSYYMCISFCGVGMHSFRLLLCSYTYVLVWLTQVKTITNKTGFCYAFVGLPISVSSYLFLK